MALSLIWGSAWGPEAGGLPLGVADALGLAGRLRALGDVPGVDELVVVGAYLSRSVIQGRSRLPLRSGGNVLSAGFMTTVAGAPFLSTAPCPSLLVWLSSGRRSRGEGRLVRGLVEVGQQLEPDGVAASSFM